VAGRCDAAVLVVGLDWRHEGEHIHPGDIAPVLHHTPPPQALARLLPRRLLEPVWAPLPALLAWITGFASAQPGSAFASGDRTDLELPLAQQRLIEAVADANPRTIVVLMGGGAILMERWRQRVAAIVLLGYPGEQGGAALADVLLGRINPSGRLPYTIPSSAAQLPPFAPWARQAHYDLWHGYRLLQKQDGKAAFPFGFGLSYSEVVCSNLSLKLQMTAPAGSLELQLQVSNNSAIATETVLQAYMEPPSRLIERPQRLLIGHRRVAIPARTTQAATISIPLRQLAWFDSKGDVFRIEPGEHRIVVADHVEDPGLAAVLHFTAMDLGP